MRAIAVLVSLPFAGALLGSLHAQEVRTGAAAFGTWEADAPGVSRHIRPTDLAPPSHADNDPEEPDFKRLAKVVTAPRQDAGGAEGLRRAGVRQGPQTASR